MTRICTIWWAKIRSHTYEHVGNLELGTRAMSALWMESGPGRRVR